MRSPLALALLILSAHPGLARADASFARTFQEPITRLEVKSGAGQVHVHGGAPTAVRANKRGCTQGETLDVRVSGTTLVVALTRPRTWGSSECEVDFDIAVPAAVAASVEVGSGDVQIAGLQGELTLRSGSGDVRLDGTPSDLSVRLGSGDFEARGLTGSAELSLGSGDVRVSYAAVPERGTLEIKSGSGDITVSLPSDARFELGFRSGAGRVENALRATPGAGFVMRVQTGAGDLAIKGHPRG